MDLVPIRLSAGAEARNRDQPPSPETVVDVLWAAAIPTDRLEHIRARHGPAPGTVDAVLFVLPTGAGPAGSAGSTTDVALRLCHRALAAAPSLSGWEVAPLDPRADAMSWEAF